MRFYIFLATFVAAVVLIECKHTFLGTNVLREQVYHKDVKYSSQFLRKRVETLNFNMPASRYIQGILAYDKTNSDASANITAGGLGFNYLTLRMKSARGEKIHFDVYIYA